MTMGSIEIYDAKKGQWVPYVPDFKKWEQHFIDISEGRVRPDHKGRYIVGSGTRNRIPSPKPVDLPKVTLVTPVAQAIEMAKSELKRQGITKRNEDPRTIPPPTNYTRSIVSRQWKSRERRMAAKQVRNKKNDKRNF